MLAVYIASGRRIRSNNMVLCITSSDTLSYPGHSTELFTFIVLPCGRFARRMIDVVFDHDCINANMVVWCWLKTTRSISIECFESWSSCKRTMISGAFEITTSPMHQSTTKNQPPGLFNLLQYSLSILCTVWGVSRSKRRVYHRVSRVSVAMGFFPHFYM